MPSPARRISLAALAAWITAVGLAYQRQHPVDWAVWEAVLRGADWAALAPTTTALARALGHMFAAAAILCAAAGVGGRVLRLLWRPADALAENTTPGERFWLSVVCGMQVLVLVVVALGAVGLLYAPVLWACVTAAVLAGAPDGRAYFHALRDALRAWRGGGAAAIVARVGIGLVLLGALPAALSPHVLHDSLVYHLGLPAAYLDAHRLVPFPHLVFANTPLNTEMLYTIAMSMGGPATAKLLHMGCGIGMVVLTASLGRRVATPAVGTLAAFLSLTAPLVLGQLPTSYVDLAAALTFLAAVWCLLHWGRTGHPGPLRVCALALGLYAGMRYTSVYGVAALGCAVLAVLAHRRRPVREWAAAAAVFAAALCIGAGPWLLKNMAHVGNPVFPLATQIFGLGPLSETQHARMNLLVTEHGMGHAPLDLLLLPWRVTVFGDPGYQTFDGVLSPVWLAALPAVLFWRHMPARVGLLGVVALAYVVMWAFSTHIARYLIPVFPVFSVLAVYGLCRCLPSEPRRRDRWLVGGVVGAALWWLPAVVPTLLGVPTYGPVAWGRESPGAYLARTDPTAPMFAYMDEFLPADARVIGLWENRMLRCPRPLEGDAVYEAPRWLDRFAREEPDELAAAFRAEGFTHILLNLTHLARYPPRATSVEDQQLIESGLTRMNAFLRNQCSERFAAADLYLYEIRAD